MKYESAPDIQRIAEEISKMLFPHVKLERMKCFRSNGTSSRGTIARCHTIGKLLQKAAGIPSFYALEFISERFDKLDAEEKIKVIIHELMHIPQTFGGGFRHHDHVCDVNIDKCYRTYKEKLKGTRPSDAELKKQDDERDFLGINELKWKNENNISKLKDMFSLK